MSIAEAQPRSPETSTSFLDQPTLNSLSNESGTANAEPSSSSSNPLNEFAQQVLGSESDAHNLLDLGRGGMGYSIIGEEQTFNDLLQSEERREQALNNNNGHDDHGHGHDHSHNEMHDHMIDPGLESELSRHIEESDNAQIQHQNQSQNQTQNQNQNHQIILDENGNEITIVLPTSEEELPSTQNNTNTNNNNLNIVYGGRIGKRKRTSHSNLDGSGTQNVNEAEQMLDADGNIVEPHEYARLKKDSHKEVERRRRENINDGINEIAQLIPGGLDKQGKGTLLKRAAAYLVDLVDKIRVGQEELGKKDAEKVDLENQIAHLTLQLQEERDRSMRFETSWREAEDRSASSNFELERLRAELEEAKAAQV
ncbi:uncharacterized protein I303_105350 [Kwoniella dejecticola CBS 10117]|uniref:BHLH domain-containing protein n=1 Tax=Kwoniella dejecticola CBS 10117 TaxID=1296121 RepID=A0A1A6A2R0_9TREE|nr:uncharacterized protein I303_05203 [Kwoniella dejecticola CBS 10117]OBR84345.1 hypothetical protein I303_05203 [Kwoniella dejecticola CBS 10117]